jgi:hypothetical protein
LAAAKKVERPVWLVTLEIPRQYMDQMTSDRLNNEKAEVNTEPLAEPNNDLTQPEGDPNAPTG